MVQVDKLVYGAGATRDAGFVSITPKASLMIAMLQGSIGHWFAQVICCARGSAAEGEEVCDGGMRQLGWETAL